MPTRARDVKSVMARIMRWLKLLSMPIGANLNRAAKNPLEASPYLRNHLSICPSLTMLTEKLRRQNSAAADQEEREPSERRFTPVFAENAFQKTSVWLWKNRFRSEPRRRTEPVLRRNSGTTFRRPPGRTPHSRPSTSG